MSLTQALERVLARRGLKLPPPPKPVGSYRPFVVEEGFAFLSGQISKDAEGRVITGKVGKELAVEEGKRAAEWAALQAVSLIQSEVGLEKVKQVVRVTGFVQSEPDFYGQSEVMNGASEIFVELFGEKGRHARSAVGVAGLPLNAAVELEVTLKL